MSTLDDRAQALLAVPSLEGLSYALRNLPALYPKFKWHYPLPSCCGWGLAEHIWGRAGEDLVFSLPYDIGRRILCEAGKARDIASRNVRPKHIADDIDSYLETGTI